MVYNLTPNEQTLCLTIGVNFLLAIIAGFLVSRKRRARRRLEVFKRELRRYDR